VLAADAVLHVGRSFFSAVIVSGVTVFPAGGRFAGCQENRSGGSQSLDDGGDFHFLRF
jgi:hypothetical protein